MSDDIVTNPASEVAPGVSFIGSEGAHEFVRYFAASGIALIIDIGTLWLLTSVFNVSYLLSGALAFTLGLITVYVLSTRWVFSSHSIKSPLAEFGMFALIGLVGLGLNELVLWLLTGLLGVFYLTSKIASVALVFTWNFAARKWFLFSNTHHA